MMQIPIYQVDAFAKRLFAGNPAAVCPLDAWLPNETLQAIAFENNLAETAYIVAEGDGRYQLRWFTPTVEVDLCGHATLASAFVIMTELNPGRREARFKTRSGELVVTRDGDLLSMDFPSRPAGEVSFSPELIGALGGDPESVLGARDYLVVYRTEAEVRALKPNMEGLSNLERFAVIVTAPGDDVDFVSRFFAPAQGIPEDPVTGSAHCTLIPYWSQRLGKQDLHARQVSPRGGNCGVQTAGSGCGLREMRLSF